MEVPQVHAPNARRDVHASHGTHCAGNRDDVGVPGADHSDARRVARTGVGRSMGSGLCHVGLQ